VGVYAIEDSLQKITIQDIDSYICVGIDRSDLRVFINEKPIEYTTIEGMDCIFGADNKYSLKSDNFYADLFFTQNDQILWHRELAIPLSQLYTIEHKDTTAYSENGEFVDAGIFHYQVNPMENMSQYPMFGQTKAFTNSPGRTPWETPAQHLPDSHSFLYVKYDNLHLATAWIDDELWDSTRVEHGEVIQYKVSVSRTKYLHMKEGVTCTDLA
jgi:hypothetical protein